jgi:hypothetical protein
MGQVHHRPSKKALMINKDVVTIRYFIMPSRTTGQINIHEAQTVEELKILLQHTMPALIDHKLVCEVRQDNKWKKITDNVEWGKSVKDFQKGPRTEPIFMRVSVKNVPLHARRAKKISSVLVPSMNQYPHKARIVLQPVYEFKQRSVDIITPEATPQKVDFNDLFDCIVERDKPYYNRSRR